MHTSSESEFVTKTKKIVQSRFFAICFLRNNISISNNFKDLSMINFKKFDNLFSNKFESFL